MIDPLSIAGLAISIFDQLLKLGERTCQLLADAKTFDDVSRISMNVSEDERHLTYARAFGHYGTPQDILLTYAIGYRCAL